MVNPIRTADRWLIDNVFQAAVDITGKSPRWCAEQCAYAFAIACVLRWVSGPNIGWLFYAGIFFDGLLAALLVLTAKVPPLLARSGMAWSSRAIWASILLLQAWIFAPDLTPMRVALLIGSVFALSFYYFAACKPPRPRVPRTRMAPAGGAA